MPKKETKPKRKTIKPKKGGTVTINVDKQEGKSNDATSKTVGATSES